MNRQRDVLKWGKDLSSFQIEAAFKETAERCDFNLSHQVGNEGLRFEWIITKNSLQPREFGDLIDLGAYNSEEDEGVRIATLESELKYQEVEFMITAGGVRKYLNQLSPHKHQAIEKFIATFSKLIFQYTEA
jgi:hypothetical protein